MHELRMWALTSILGYGLIKLVDCVAERANYSQQYKRTGKCQ